MRNLDIPVTMIMSGQDVRFFEWLQYIYPLVELK